MLALGLVMAVAAAPAPWLPPPRPLPAAAMAHPPLTPRGTQILFLNFDGTQLHYDAGCSDALAGCSFIVGGAGTVSYPAFHGTSAQKQQILELVRSYFEPFDIQIVTTRPMSGRYSMNMVGGLPDAIGIGPGVVGVAPLDCGDMNDIDVSFTFSQVVANNPVEVAQTISQESAHAYGLGHTNDRTDVMYPVVEMDADGFQNRLMTIPDQSDCIGNGTQNSYRAMMDTIGPSAPDVEPPTIAVVDPAPGTVLPSGFSVTFDAHDDRSVYEIGLWAGPELIATRTRAPWTFMVPSGTLAGGPVQLRGVARDRMGNSAEAGVQVTVKKLGETPGDLGTSCTTDHDCNGGGTCAAPRGNNQVCTRDCNSTVLACPTGFDCVATPQFQSQCAAVPHEEGCSAAPGARPAGGFAVWVLLAMLLRRRRPR